MRKVLFVQNMWIEFLGVMTLSSYLKCKGHDCDIVVGGKNAIVKKIKEFKPDFLAFSTMTIQHNWVLDTAKYLRAIGVSTPIIIGGPQATFFPAIIENPQVDIVCKGEGEEALADLLDLSDGNLDYSAVKNLCVKKQGKIFDNEVRTLRDDLDTLPFPDRHLYDRYPYFNNRTYEIFMATRGCPYSCNFCFNHAQRKIYKDKGRYIRLRSAKNVIEEIKSVEKKRNIKLVMFTDSTFNLDKKWFLEFMDEYRKNVDIPYSCNLHAGLLDEDIVKAISETNCANVRFAIETGNEKLRKNVLNKQLSNEQIRNTARLLKKYKIRLIAFNMFGLPTETLENAFETIKLNQEVKPYAVSNDIFLPFPGLEITKYAIEKGIIKENDTEKLGRSPYKMFVSILNQPGIKKVCNLHKFSFIAMRFPWTETLIRIIILLPRNYIFNFIYGVSHSYTFKKWSNSSWVRIIKEILLNFDKFS